MVAGVAALVAGAMSMAAGEYVSVSSQSDTEKSDLATEKAALKAYPEAELQELADIYVARGVQPDTARTVAAQLMEHDALGAHARDELGMNEFGAARPIQAALSSAASFAVGAALPLVAAWLAPPATTTPVVAAVSLVSLVVLGWVSAAAGGAGKIRAVVRVVFWGAAAMIVTGAIGHLFGTVV
jgi:vacuolar iron transporter family protein